MIRTTLTRMFDLRCPIVLAPMGAVTGAHLAAAARGDFDVAATWVGEGADLIDRVQPAAEWLRAIVEQARAQRSALVAKLA